MRSNHETQSNVKYRHNLRGNSNRNNRHATFTGGNSMKKVKRITRTCPFYGTKFKARPKDRTRYCTQLCGVADREWNYGNAEYRKLATRTRFENFAKIGKPGTIEATW